LVTSIIIEQILAIVQNFPFLTSFFRESGGELLLGLKGTVAIAEQERIFLGLNVFSQKIRL